MYHFLMKYAAIVTAALFGATFVHVAAHGCSLMQWDPNATVENPRIESPDRTYTLVIRQHPELGDFETTTEGALAGLTPPFETREEDEASEFLPDDYDPYVPEEPLEEFEAVAIGNEPVNEEVEEPQPLEVALYRNDEAGGRDLVATFFLEEPFPPARMLVSEGGTFVVTVEIPEGFVVSSCGGSWLRPGIVIYAASKGTYRRIEFDDLLSESDIEWLRHGAFGTVTFRIRTMPNTGSQVLTMSLPPAGSWQVPTEIDIDLRTGVRLQPPQNIYPPVRRIVVEPSTDAPSSQGCDEGSVGTVESAELLDRATHEVAPVYTEVARRAFVGGKVILEVVVGQDGTVSCVRVIKGLPFGLDVAAVDAVRQWRFETDDGNAPFVGVLEVRFEVNTHRTERRALD